MPQPKDKDWLNGYKNKTPTYVVICIAEVINISPHNLDSSLCFIYPSVSNDAYNLNMQSDNVQP